MELKSSAEVESADDQLKSEERRHTCAKQSLERGCTDGNCYESRSMIRASAGWKRRLAKAAGAEVAVQRGNEKWHAVVARSTFASQNAKKTVSLGALFEVALLKNGTPLWREAHFQVKMHKHQRFGALLEVQMSPTLSNSLSN